MRRFCGETSYTHTHRQACNTHASYPMFGSFDQLHAWRIIMQVVSRSRGLKLVRINRSSVEVEVVATHQSPSVLPLHIRHGPALHLATFTLHQNQPAASSFRRAQTRVKASVSQLQKNPKSRPFAIIKYTLQWPILIRRCGPQRACLTPAHS